ncbi:MAG: protein kinase, partial [Deltaproteobacteria bacterium]|nr:protein kinase [Deltaproteobacteria bacterium]
KIVEKLGEGGMGVVFKAEDIKLNRFVALKFLPPELTRDPEAKERFIHEAQAASGLEHNNICTIHEIDETEDGQMFICMAYYEGETLKKKLKRGPLKFDEAIDIAIQVAQGLSKAHAQGIVHRDIKPANIMITNDGVVKIVDFGLAKLSGQTKLTKEGTTLGTVAYMSPEQAQGEAVDHRTDIWSLGVVLYETVTGQLPFKGEYEQAMLYSILNVEPEPLTALRTGVPIELEQLDFKALAKNPEERFQHADELLAELLRMQKSMTTKPMRKVPTPSISLWHRLLTSPILWMVIIVLFGLAGGVLLFYPSSAIPFSERDWILITDFENLTGEQVFDKSLTTALSVSLGQSSYINVFPRRRIGETLRRMKKEKVKYIDEAIGQEIAAREGINVQVVPSISLVGNIYVLTGIIQDPITGESLKSEIVRAKGKDKVLNALDELSKKIRRDLGESFIAISKKSKPLRKVTTSSLEALKQYSLGIENHWDADFEEARLYYESALRIDSNFTAAKASLGMIHFEKFDRDKGKELLDEAVQDVADLTDKEKYGILAFHARGVENDLEKAVNYLKMLVALYPDYCAAHNNLGWYFQQMGRYEDAVVEYKKALRIDPYLMLPYSGMNWIYLYNLGELDSAIVCCKRQISYDGQNAWAYDNLGWAFLGKDSLKRAQKAFEKALEINPQFIWDLYRLAFTYRLQGHFQEAIRPLEKILEIDPTESSAHYNLGIIYQLLGNAKAAYGHLEQFRKDVEKWVLEDPDNGNNYVSLGMVLTRLGQKEQGWNMGQKGMAIDSTQHFEFAQLLSVQGKKQEALDHLELAVQKGFTNYIWMKIHPDLQALYEEPQFKDLINRVLKN